MNPSFDSETIEVTFEELKYLKYFTLIHRSRLYFRRIIKYNLQPLTSSLNDIKDNIKNLLNYIPNESIVIALMYGYINEEEIEMKLKENIPFIINSTNMFTMNERDQFTTPESVLTHLHFHNSILGSYIFVFNNSDAFEANHLVNNYYQIGYISDILIAESSLLITILDDVARDFLLLGNLKVLELSRIDSYLYLDFHVQHFNLNPEAIDKQLDIIIESLESKIRRLNNEEFDAYKNKIIFKMNKPFQTLYNKAQVVWEEIYKNTLDFKRKSIDMLLENYSKDQLIRFYKKVFIDKQSLKRISIQLFKDSPDEYYPQINKTIKYRLNQEINSILTDDIDFFRKLH